MKPDWSEAPEWAKYLAQDEAGYWRWYMFPPWAEVNISPGFWESRRHSVKAGKGERNAFWKDTLEMRPKEIEDPLAEAHLL